jgi:hypothetical protein
MISLLPGRSMTQDPNRTLSAYVMDCSGRGLPALHSAQTVCGLDFLCRISEPYAAIRRHIETR